MNIKTIFVLFLSINSIKACFSQENRAYILNQRNDMITLGVGFGLSLYAYYKESNTLGLTTTARLELNKSDINGFDRFAIENSSERAAQISDLGLYTALASSALLLAPKEGRNHFKELLVMGLQAVSLNYAATYLSKTAFLRNRPYMYRSSSPFDQMDKEGRLSFISGHSSFSAVSMVYVYTAMGPFLKKPLQRNLLLASTIALPSAVAYLRVRAGKHFPTDVIAGMATGAVIGYLVPTLHASKSKKLDYSFWGSGFKLTYHLY
ncbi:MAG: phosphatase PAP2 family protein [Bacteroidia bacterium]